ncbi:MAG: SH3 domain-containing protein, partial [Myxococcota bacterium]|nr:SH3 domain-containing protein [Myxococcota bacterium]
MRVSVLILVLLFGVAGDPAISHAEKVRTNQPTKLYARPGERAKVLLKVDEGKAMTVIAKEGRWLKVRVSGRTGFVARSTVDMPGGDEIARNTRRRPFVDGRGVKRGFGGASDEAPDDRIGADAVGEGQEDGGDDDADDEDADEDVKKPIAKVTKIKPAVEAVKPKTKPAVDEDDEDPLDEGDEDADAGDEDADDEEEVDTRKKARVASKTPVYVDPDAKSEQIYVAKAGEVLFPTGETKGKYTEVENEEGDLGYVLSSSLDVQK